MNIKITKNDSRSSGIERCSEPDIKLFNDCYLKKSKTSTNSIREYVIQWCPTQIGWRLVWEEGSSDHQEMATRSKEDIKGRL